MKARDIMSENVQMVEEEITVADAMKHMIETKTFSLIVNRSYDDDSYGIATRRDVINKVIATGKSPYKLKIKDINLEFLLFIVHPEI